MVKTLKISDKTHSNFLKIIGELMSISGKKVNQDEALMSLIDSWRKNKK